MHNPRPYRARYRCGIWSVWRIEGRHARIVSSSRRCLDDALFLAKLRNGAPLPLAVPYPLERLRAM